MGTIREKVIFAVLCVVSGMAVTAAPAVLQEMPADAGFILVTEPLAQLSGKLDVLGHQLGLLAQDKPFDLTALLSANVGIPGIDSSRGIGVAAPDLLSMQKGVLLYLPVQDAKAAMESLKTNSGATALVGQEDIMRIPGPEVYAKASGQYVIASENAEMLTSVSQKAKGVKLNAESQKIFDTSQCAFLIDIKPMVPIFQAIAQNPAALGAMTGGGMGPGADMNQPPQQPACVTAIEQMAFARLGEVEFLAGGVQLGTDGITMLTHTQAQAGSKLAAFFSHPSSTDISKFKTLPSGAFNWAMVTDMDQKAFEPVIKGIMNAISSDPVATGKIGSANMAVLSDLLPRLTTTDVSMADYATEQEQTAGTGMAVQKMMAWITCDNAVDKIDQMKQAVPLFTQIMTAMGMPIVIDYKSQSGTIGEKQYDEVVTDMSQLPMPPAQKQMLMNQMGGKLSESYYLCRTDMHNIAYAATPDQLQKLIAFPHSGQPGLDQNPDIVKTAAYLPKQANMYLFMQPGNCVRSMLTKTDPMMMMVFGMFSQLPGVVGTSATLQNGYINSQTYIPNDMIQSVVTLVSQMQQQMQPPPGMYPNAPGGDAEGPKGPDQTGTPPPSNPPY